MARMKKVVVVRKKRIGARPADPDENLHLASLANPGKGKRRGGRRGGRY
jgi:hypothetical protein